MNRKDYPILEFDPSRKAVIEAANEIEAKDVPENCVLCFFQEVIDDDDEQLILTAADIPAGENP